MSWLGLYIPDVELKTLWQLSKMAAWGGLTNKPHRKLDKNMNMFLVGLEVGKEKIQRKRDVAGS